MVTEESIYRLEAYLDGALDSVETAKLLDRLEREPALRAALAELKACRSLREATWAYMFSKRSSTGRFSSASACATSESS